MSPFCTARVKDSFRYPSSTYRSCMCDREIIWTQCSQESKCSKCVLPFMHQVLCILFVESFGNIQSTTGTESNQRKINKAKWTFTKARQRSGSQASEAICGRANSSAVSIGSSALWQKKIPMLYVTTNLSDFLRKITCIVYSRENFIRCQYWIICCLFLKKKCSILAFSAFEMWKAMVVPDHKKCARDKDNYTVFFQTSSGSYWRRKSEQLLRGGDDGRHLNLEVRQKDQAFKTNLCYIMNFRSG